MSFDVPTSMPVVMGWKMPKDLQSLPGFLKAFAQAHVDDDCAAKFWHVLQNGDVDAALSTFSQTFERTAEQTYGATFGQRLPAACGGRAKGCMVPIRPGRVRALVDGSFATDRVVVGKRLRVLRLVLELTHLRAKCDVRPSAACHNLWRKICAAPGFPGGFREWVLSNDLVNLVPVNVPSLAWLQTLASALRQEAEQWDVLVKKQRAHRIAAAMQADWSSGGRCHARAIKDEQLPPLNSLALSETVHVSCRRVSKGSPAKFTLVHGQEPIPGTVWVFGPTRCRVTSFCQGVVTLDRPMSSAMYCKSVKQQTWCANPYSVFQCVASFWDGFRLADRQIDLDFLQHVTNHLPELDKFDPIITLSELQWALKTSKNGTARGLDGFSVPELKAMPHNLQLMLLSLLNHITCTGKWPDKLYDATVALLAKIAQPASAKDARPITVLATLYRVWARCIAAKIYSHLLPFLPPELYGSIPGKSAMDLAWILQNEVETALHTNQHVAGFSLDLSKAYNTISRHAVRVLAKRLGWPETVIDAYQNFLFGVRRHFRVAEHLFPPRVSKVGVPEGCPLAVLSMIIVTWAVSGQVQACHDIPLRSYVDNWRVQAPSPQLACAATSTVAASSQKLGMTLSMDKLVGYATHKKFRGFLRQFVLEGSRVTVAHDFADLGVQFCARRAACAKGVQDRVDRNGVKLDRLQTMPWSLARKVACLTKFIFPSVFYGSEISSVSVSALRGFRGKCNKALWGPNNQRNHFLAPLLGAGEVYEPFLYVFKKRWTTLKRVWARYPSIRCNWNALLEGPALQGGGPLTYFFADLRSVGWDPLPDGLIAVPDHDNLSILLSNWDVVYSQVLVAWQRHVVTKVQGYKGLQGLSGFSVSLVRGVLSTDQGYDAQVANYSCGAIVPASRRKHFTSQDDLQCPFCQAELSIKHMLLGCPATLQCREALQIPSDLSDFELLWGLFRTPPEVEQYHTLLRDLNWKPVPKLFVGQEVHLFTDGSTQQPKNSILSLSAWAVVLAEPGKLNGACVLRDFVPGQHHTNNRAELYGVLAAVLLGDGGTVYSDSKISVDGFGLLLKYGFDALVRSQYSNLDIWFAIHEALLQCHGTWRIVKVKSHQAWHSAPDDWHAWLWYHNDMADEFAKAVLLPKDCPAVQHHRSAVQAFDRTCRAQRLVYKLHRGVADVFQSKSRITKQAPHDLFSDRSLQSLQAQFQDRVGMMVADVGVVFPKGCLPNWDTFLLCAPFAQLLFAWCSQCCWVPDEQGFSLVEFYLAFTRETGWLAPVNVASWEAAAKPAGLRDTLVKAAWVHEVQYPQISLCAQPLTAQLLVFSHVIRAVFLACQCPWKPRAMFALRWLGVPCKVPALTMRPQYHHVGEVCQNLSRLFTGRKYRQVLKQGYTVVQKPVAAQIPFRSPREIFNAQRRAHRQAR